MNGLGLRIGRVGAEASIGDWLAAKQNAHAGDAAFVAPLNLMERKRITPKGNPFFARGEATFFVAFRAGHPVGRISAQIIRDDPHFTRSGIGYFGFFDVAEDREAATALVDRAREWLRARGAREMRGPFNLSINEECGCQIDAFHLRPAYMMPQSRPWTAPLLHETGLAKAVDTHAWRVAPQAVSDRAQQIGAVASDLASVRARPIRKDRFQQEIQLLAEIFNDAWAENWGFVALAPAEIDAMAAELRLIYRASYGYFVELDGAPVGVLIGLPNINEAIADFGGRLNPLRAIRLASRLFGEGIRSSRIPLVGIRQRYQSGLTGALITAALAKAALAENRRRPVDWFEFSWVLETNAPARRYLSAIGATPTITYRLFEGAV